MGLSVGEYLNQFGDLDIFSQSVSKKHTECKTYSKAESARPSEERCLAGLGDGAGRKAM